MLADYKHYRDMIEDQVKKINAAFEKDTITETHGALLAPVSNTSSAVAPNGVTNRRFFLT